MKRSSVLIVLVFSLTVALAASRSEAACPGMPLAQGLISLAYAAEADIMLQYFGHNFFQITTRQGTKIVTDPLAPGRYPTPNITPHVVTVGREHPNHNYVQLAQGNPLILHGLTQHGAEWNRVSTHVREVFIHNVPIYQNGFAGALKGAAFVFDLGPLCLAHLGDLSHPLTPEQLQQMGEIDVVLIPIGGTYTMGPDIARDVLQQINPKLAIPMHYRDNLTLVNTFAQGFVTRYLDGDTLLVSKSSLPSRTEIVVLRPKGARE